MTLLRMCVGRRVSNFGDKMDCRRGPQVQGCSYSSDSKVESLANSAATMIRFSMRLDQLKLKSVRVSNFDNKRPSKAFYLIL